MSEGKTNGFKELTLKKVRNGEETIESLERKLESSKNTKNFQDVREGIEAALEILKSNPGQVA